MESLGARKKQASVRCLCGGGLADQKPMKKPGFLHKRKRNSTAKLLELERKLRRFPAGASALLPNALIIVVNGIVGDIETLADFFVGPNGVIGQRIELS